MKISDFKLERYFAKYEFSAKYLISSSDCDGYSLDYLLSCASEEDLNLWNDLHFGYTDSAGSFFLRDAISCQYQKIPVDGIAVMSPGEANFILMNLLVERGDVVICMSPAYQSLYQVAEDLGAVLKWWKPDELSMKFHISELKKLVTKETKIIIVNFPHNPTGYIPSADELNEIVSIARKHNTILFSDEMYHQLVDSVDLNIPAVCDLYENGISLWGMAKSFGLAGLRVGWLATQRKDILHKVLSFKDYLSICNNAAGEVLTKIALANKEKFICPNIIKIIENRKLFAKFAFRNKEFVKYNHPCAGSTAFVKLNIDVTSLNYCENLVEKTGVMMVPSEMFSYGNKHVRIGFGRKNFSESLAEWEKYILSGNK